jgi:hypothetical protein
MAELVRDDSLLALRLAELFRIASDAALIAAHNAAVSRHVDRHDGRQSSLFPGQSIPTCVQASMKP